MLIRKELSLKLYIASSWRNPYFDSVVAQLANMGYEIYNFKQPTPGPNKGFHWSEIDAHWKEWTPDQFRFGLVHPLAQEGFVSDMIALHWCDACVLVMPCGRSAHLELGWATGAGKKTIILLEDGEPELMYSMADHLCVSTAEVIEVLENWKADDIVD